MFAALHAVFLVVLEGDAALLLARLVLVADLLAFVHLLRVHLQAVLDLITHTVRGAGALQVAGERLLECEGGRARVQVPKCDLAGGELVAAAALSRETLTGRASPSSCLRIRGGTS